MKKVPFLWVILAGCYVQATAQVSSPLPFKAGDRVAFVGNSITEAGYYESYIWLYYMLHFPDQRITVFNVGIGGDRAQNIADRFDDDVLPKKPDVICLTFGMNDSGYYEFLSANADSGAKARVQESYHYFQAIETKLKALPGVEKVLITSSPYDETVKNPKNYFPKKSLAMLGISKFQEQAAIDNHWAFVDFFRPMTDINLREQKRDSAFTLTGSDRIHPGNPGHFVMAYLFLKAQGLAAKPVANMAINTASQKVDTSENCEISSLAVTPGSLRFDYLAHSLPYPVDTVPRMWENPHRQSEAVGLIPYYDTFDREILRITGLKTGSYDVAIDGHTIGQWTNAALAGGINLASLTNTPEYDQAMSVMLLNEERMGIELRFRAYYWLQFDFFRGLGMMYADNKAAMDSVNTNASKNWAVASKRDNYRMARYATVREGWQKEMDALVDEIYSINTPRKHRIEIKPSAVSK